MTFLPPILLILATGIVLGNKHYLVEVQGNGTEEDEYKVAASDYHGAYGQGKYQCHRYTPEQKKNAHGLGGILQEKKFCEGLGYGYKFTQGLVSKAPGCDPSCWCCKPIKGCTGGWTEYSSSCYKLGKGKKTWADAEKKCNEEGAHLASVASLGENWSIHNLLKNIQNPVWLGGTDGAAEGTWVFTDGTKVTHNAWSDNQPDNFGGGQDCLTTNFKGPDWDDAVCSEHYNFVCEKKKGYGCTGGWTEYSSSCFKLGRDKKTWADAEKKCVEEGGHLASVGSFGENWSIHMLLKNIQNPVWLGGTDGAAEGTWVFTDGTRVTHTAWSDGQPDNLGGGQHCLATNFKGPDWDDAWCGANYNFVCEKKKW